jgi:hypothetical protein
MIQDIIVYILVLLAFAKAMHSIVKLFLPVKAVNTPVCKGCSACNSSKLNELQKPDA